MSSSHHSHVIEGTQHVTPHHFEDAEHEFHASKFGMWLFLVTEVLLFGGLFVAFIMFQGLYPEEFKRAHHELNWRMGAVNTIALLTSSLTMALSVHFAQTNKRVRSAQMLVLTLICAGIFMVVKYFEYTHKFHLGILPAKHYHFEELKGPIYGIFFSLYFVMTGLHGLHVLIGMGLISWVLVRTRKGHFNNLYYTPVEITGLYWHLVDLIWIFLFPLLYLIS